MKVFRSVLRVAIRIAIVVNIALVAGTTLMLVVDILFRHIGGRSLPAAYDLTELFILIISGTALLWLDGERDHIGFSILIDKLSENYRVWVEVFWRACSIPLLVLLAVTGFQRTIASFASNEARMGILELPVWPSRLLMAIVFATLALLALFYILDALVNRRITSVIERVHDHDVEGNVAV